MAVGLLWSALALLLLTLALIIASELRKKENRDPVLLIFLENSEEFCEAVLRQICRRSKHGNTWEQIMVVDHYSTDSSPEIVSRLQRYYPQIELLIRSERNRLNYCRLEMLAGRGFRVLDLRDISSKDFLPLRGKSFFNEYFLYFENLCQSGKGCPG
jgi:hypothetical protein